MRSSSPIHAESDSFESIKQRITQKKAVVSQKYMKYNPNFASRVSKMIMLDNANSYF